MDAPVRAVGGLAVVTVGRESRGEIDTASPTLWTCLVPALTAFVLRVVYVLETREVPFARHLVGDAAGYWAWAKSIVGGDWFGAQGFYQAPLYPYVLAVIFGVGNDDVQVVRFTQAVFGAVSAGLLALAASRMFGRRVGLVSGLMLALYGPAVFYDGLIQKASLGGLLVCSLVVLLSGGSGSRRRWIVVGAVLGLLALTRENALVWIPVVGLWILLRGDRRVEASPVLLEGGPRAERDPCEGTLTARTSAGGTLAAPADSVAGSHSTGKSERGGACAGRVFAARRKRVVGLACLLCGTGGVLLPVAWRNAFVSGDWSISTFQAGPNFYIGNRVGASGRYAPLVPGHETPAFERRDATRLAEIDVGRAMSPREVSRYWMAKSLDAIRSEPAAWVRLMCRKAMMVWNAYEVADVEAPGVYARESVVLRWLGGGWHFGVLVPLSALGVVLTRTRWRQLWVYYGMIASMAMAVAMFYIMGRYRFPLVPLLMPFAAAGVVGLWDAARSRRLREIGGASIMALVVAVVANLKVHPEDRLDAAGFMNAGSALAMAGKLDRAEAWMRLGVDRQPGSATANANCGQLLALQGRYDEAIPFYQRAITIEPALPLLAYNYAVALERVGRAAEALALYRRAVEDDPTDTAARTAVVRLTQEP